MDIEVGYIQLEIYCRNLRIGCIILSVHHHFTFQHIHTEIFQCGDRIIQRNLPFYITDSQIIEKDSADITGKLYVDVFGNLQSSFCCGRFVRQGDRVGRSPGRSIALCLAGRFGLGDDEFIQIYSVRMQREVTFQRFIFENIRKIVRNISL